MSILRGDAMSGKVGFTDTREKIFESRDQLLLKQISGDDEWNFYLDEMEIDPLNLSLRSIASSPLYL